jgi:exonuclease VII large subunit
VGSLVPRILQLIDRQKSEIKHHLEIVAGKIERSIDENIVSISNFKNILTQLDPNKILDRGYAIIRGTIKKGLTIEIETNKAILEAEVRNVTSK